MTVGPLGLEDLQGAKALGPQEGQLGGGGRALTQKLGVGVRRALFQPGGRE